MNLGSGFGRWDGVEVFELLNDMLLNLVGLVHASPHTHQSVNHVRKNIKIVQLSTSPSSRKKIKNKMNKEKQVKTPHKKSI